MWRMPCSKWKMCRKFTTFTSGRSARSCRRFPVTCAFRICTWSKARKFSRPSGSDWRTVFTSRIRPFSSSALACPRRRATPCPSHCHQKRSHREAGGKGLLRQPHNADRNGFGDDQPDRGHVQSHEHAGPQIPIVQRVSDERGVKHGDPDEKHERQQNACEARQLARCEAECGREESCAGKIRQEQTRRHPRRNQRCDEVRTHEVLNTEYGQRPGDKQPSEICRRVDGLAPNAG